MHGFTDRDATGGAGVALADLVATTVTGGLGADGNATGRLRGAYADATVTRPSDRRLWRAGIHDDGPIDGLADGTNLTGRWLPGGEARTTVAGKGGGNRNQSQHSEAVEERFHRYDLFFRVEYLSFTPLICRDFQLLQNNPGIFFAPSKKHRPQGRCSGTTTMRAA